VRSRTAASITLAMPIPPTTRLMAAIAVISRSGAHDRRMHGDRMLGNRLEPAVSRS
jgi:hypothetical protein